MSGAVLAGFRLDQHETLPNHRAGEGLSGELGPQRGGLIVSHRERAQVGADEVERQTLAAYQRLEHDPAEAVAAERHRERPGPHQIVDDVGSKQQRERVCPGSFSVGHSDDELVTREAQLRDRYRFRFRQRLDVPRRRGPREQATLVEPRRAHTVDRRVLPRLRTRVHPSDQPREGSSPRRSPLHPAV
jgi:hypothetical protein